MKKELLGSTIIVASTLLFAMPVAAAEKPTISFSGYTRAEVSFVDQDLDVGRKRGYHFETDENYLNWTAKGTADNGLTYSATAKMEFNGAGRGQAGGTIRGKDTIGTDEAYLTFGGEWGTVVMGDDDGADDIMMVGGYSLLTAGFGYDGGYGSSVNFSSGGSGAQVFASLVGDTGDATKVSYFTPRWNGLQLGASWTPDSGHTFDEGLGGSNDNDGSRENNLGLGINYNQTHGDVGIKFGATYGTGEFEDTAAVTGASDTEQKLPHPGGTRKTSLLGPLAATSATPVFRLAWAMVTAAIRDARNPNRCATQANGGTLPSNTSLARPRSPLAFLPARVIREGTYRIPRSTFGRWA